MQKHFLNSAVDDCKETFINIKATVLDFLERVVEEKFNIKCMKNTLEPPFQENLWIFWK